MKKVSKLLESIIGSNTGLKTYISISNNWEYIVGPELDHLTSLNSVSCTPDGEYIVYINVIGACSIIAKSNEHIILDRIKNVIKYKKIKNIVFKHCSEISKSNENAA